MIIKNAMYGGIDCTKQVVLKVNGNKLFIRSDNNIIGDPTVGILKELVIKWIDKSGIEKEERAKEGSSIIIPKTNHKRLGIFYSNNNNKSIYPAIDKSLQSINIASEGKADIITCVWQPQPGNPFVELKSWYTQSSHINQLLQIMQTLYVAKEMGSYDYVSFLEHDVLYPEGYFDYPDFNNGEVFTNMNYGGVNADGWQKRKRNHNDEPFHQMTMRFTDAIDHCLSILPNALRTNSGNIEADKIIRKQWECDNESIHVNHGIHFTSHNSIYDKENTYSNHPYWGNHADYLNIIKID